MTTKEIANETSNLDAKFDVPNFMHHLGVDVVSLDAGSCELQLSFQENLSVTKDVFHTGVVAAMLDMAVTMAAKNVAPDGGKLVIAEQKLNIFSRAKGNQLIAVATVVKAGRTLTVVEANIYVIKGSTRTQCALSLATLITE
ncbi:MAG: PaaI family thioesterase [Pseudomonas marincola]